MNSRHLHSLLQQATTLPHLLQLHTLLLKTALDHRSHRSVARLITALSPLSLRHARSVFDCLTFTPPTYTCNSLIRAYAQTHCSLDAIRLFSDIRRLLHVQPNKFTYPFVLKACADYCDTGVGRMIHGLVVKVGLLLDLYVGNTLLRLYACGGDFGCARKVFDGMCVRDVVTWSSMIEGSVACDRPHEALMVFQRMGMVNVKPNSVTLVSLLSACGHLASLKSGRSVHVYIIVNAIPLHVALGTALVDMYARCGQIEEAYLVFKSMEEKDLQSWTIMISGFTLHGRGEEAISLFSQMEMIGLKPDSMSFSGILSACSHSGLVDEGQNFFNKMVNLYNIEPTMEHYGCMVDLYGRAGLLEAAYDFIREMPVTPNKVVLRSLLGACKNYNVIPGIDAKLMELLLKEESHLGSDYVLAANVTALSGRWDHVAQLRSNISKKGLKKVSGRTWLEANAMST